MYWQDETPEILNTGKNILKYFKQARKLQVCMPFWKNDAGEERQGKTVSLNLTPLYESDTETLEKARSIFTDIVKCLDERMGGN